MDIFDNYVKLFDMNNNKIKVKYDHTYRVAAYAVRLAKYLKLNDRDVYLAYLCGMFHDIARFVQARDFNTFNDSISFDHGDVGGQIFLSNIADKLDITDDEKELIYVSIVNHNKYSFAVTSERQNMFCKIIRDADKLDILYLFSTGYKKQINVDGVSKKVHDDFYKHIQILKTDAKTECDDALVHIALVFDINYDESFRIIKENKYYDGLRKIYNNEVFNEYFNEIDKYLMEV